MNSTILIIVALICIATGALCGYLFAHSRTVTLAALSQEREKQAEQLQAAMTDLQNRFEKVSAENTRLTAEKQALLSERELIEKHLRQEIETKDEQHKQQIDTLKIEFKNLATEILEQKSNGLKENNKEQLQPLFAAIKGQMDKVEATLRQTREDSVAQKASLDQAMKDMIERTIAVGVEADKLTKALRGGDKKKQGIYGELVLSQILKDSGLKEGVNFDCQNMIRDEQGNAVRNDATDKKMIPDVIVHFADKDLIIDSKTSLSAYVDWCNAESDEERNDAVKRHIASIRNHINELVTVSYPAYLKNAQKTTIDYAIMFIPNESAFQLMMQEAPSLWHEAYEKKIIITSQLALFSMLRMIQVSWLRIEQQKNQETILNEARLLINRVADFSKYFNEIGKRLSAATDAFNDARSKMTDGKQSIAVSGKRLVALGAKLDTNKTLPEPDETGLLQ